MTEDAALIEALSAHAESHCCGRDIADLLREFEVKHLGKLLMDFRNWDLHCGSASRSHETSTHYKWWLVGNESTQEVLWLHVYKRPSSMVRGYAESAHDHRYSFTSLILRGGYTNSSHQFSNGHLSKISDELLLQGSILHMHPAAIHSLSGIQAGTITLVFQQRPARTSSFVYRSSERRAIPDFAERLPLLIEALQSTT
jgi:hypothetical protein